MFFDEGSSAVFRLFDSGDLSMTAVNSASCAGHGLTAANIITCGDISTPGHLGFVTIEAFVTPCF